MKKVLFEVGCYIGTLLSEKAIEESIGKKSMPEIALVGRSNVGKSSLINHLLHQTNLAHVSSKPGKTISIHFYSVDHTLVLVDLPGYGYAARSHKMQADWGEQIDTYLTHRKSLKMILLLVDSRRDFSKEDLQIIDWALFHKKHLLLIFTKSDTLNPYDRKRLSEKASLLFPHIRTVNYSIKDGKSRQKLISDINSLLKEDYGASK